MNYNMEKQIFIKKLTDEEQLEIINFICDKFSIDDKEKYEKFYFTLINYVKNVRRKLDTFKNNINDVIELFISCGYNNNQIIDILTIEPSLLHSDKNSIFWRLLLLGKIYETSNNMCVRDEYIIVNPRILRISQDVMYARIKYLESDEIKFKLRKTDFLSVRQIVKNTHKEFKDSYGIDKDTLLALYPFDKKAQLEVISWHENKELLDNIYNGKTNGKSI